jgi:pimeloyl-ACP methyl ester carboxylesterase
MTISARSRPSTIVADGLELFVQEDGPVEASDRTPVLMLHGCARNGNIWGGWIPTLSRKYRVLRPDIRGCGSSGDPGPDYVFKVDDMVADLLAILDGLELEHVHHIGESTGGIVGAVAAARYPERFRSLTLVSTPIAPANGNLAVKAPGGATTPEEAFTKLGLKEWWLQSRGLTGDLFGDERDEVIATDFARTPLHVALSMWTAMHQPELTIRPYLERLTMPTLVLTPTKSYTMTPAQQRELVSALPNVRQLVYEGAPHGMFYLRSDELARDTLAFIEGLG